MINVAKTVPTDGIITIRQVINGWIVHVGGGNDYEIPDTLVFNSVDDLCEALKLYYEEQKNETQRPDKSSRSPKETVPPF
jgi:hypothetical protein